MIGRWPLWRKFVGLALLNVLLLALVVIVFAASQFQLGPESLLLGPAKDRIEAIADSFALDLQSTHDASRDALFAVYRQRYHADFYLIDPQGGRIAGPEIQAPSELLERLHNIPAPNKKGRRPPPPPRKGGRKGPPPRVSSDGPPSQDSAESRPPRPIDDNRPPPPDDAEPLPPPPEARPDPGRPRGPDGRPTQAFLFITTGPLTYWAGSRMPVSNGEGPQPAILLIRSNSLFSGNIFFDWRPWLGAAAIVIAVSVLCWLPFVRSLTHSISQMDRVTQQIAEGRFDVQVASNRNDELGHLGLEIDALAARLQSFVKNQKRFLGDIAHELCAPIARVQFALGILERKSDDAQQPHVARLNEEIQEMSALVNELLSFSKAGLQMGSAPVAKVDLAAVAQRVASREALSGAAIEVQIPEGLSAMANEAYLQRSLSNVLRNAVRYAAASGPITIAASREGSKVSITVADCGPGLPESELEEVFAPFYRPEAARTRETGGAGLGLAIVKSCVEACGGTVACRNRPPSGLEVAITLPAA